MEQRLQPRDETHSDPLFQAEAMLLPIGGLHALGGNVPHVHDSDQVWESEFRYVLCTANWLHMALPACADSDLASSWPGTDLKRFTFSTKSYCSINAFKASTRLLNFRTNVKGFSGCSYTFSPTCGIWLLAGQQEHSVLARNAAPGIRSAIPRPSVLCGGVLDLPNGVGWNSTVWLYGSLTLLRSQDMDASAGVS